MRSDIEYNWGLLVGILACIAFWTAVIYAASLLVN